MNDDNGDKKSLKINYSPIVDKEEIVQKIMMVVEDVTELEKLVAINTPIFIKK